MRKKIDPQALANMLGAHLAMNEDGRWNAYNCIPGRGVMIWCPGSIRDVILLFGRNVDIDYDGDWKDSLFIPQDEGCEHCRKSYTVQMFKFAERFVDPYDKTLEVQVTETDLVRNLDEGEVVYESVKDIAYCPFCGRKL